MSTSEPLAAWIAEDLVWSDAGGAGGPVDVVSRDYLSYWFDYLYALQKDRGGHDLLDGCGYRSIVITIMFLGEAEQEWAIRVRRRRPTVYVTVEASSEGRHGPAAEMPTKVKDDFGRILGAVFERLQIDAAAPEVDPPFRPIRY